MAAPAKKVEGKGNKRKRAPALESVEKMAATAALPPPEKLEQASSPYPEGVRVFTYHPKDGSEPILLAMNGFDNPSKVWLFDLAQLPPLAQTWQWMQKANVPKGIQRQCQLLSDDEYFEMFNEWFDAMMKANNAPNGAVTVGK